MFAAKHHFKAGAGPKAYGPGDAIPDFEAWPEQNKRAMLRLGWVVKNVEAPEVTTPAAKPGISVAACPECGLITSSAHGLAIHVAKKHRP